VNVAAVTDSGKNFYWKSITYQFKQTRNCVQNHKLLEIFWKV